MALSTTIPFDIFGNIVSELHDNPSLLATVSLVSESFRWFSQHALFAKINLSTNYYDPDDLRRTIQLEAIFASNPTLGSYVREFVWKSVGYGHHPVARSQSAHISCNVIPSLLGCLQNITHLMLSVEWAPQPATWKAAVLKLCATPTLHHLRLVKFDKFAVYEVPKIPQPCNLGTWCTLLSNHPGGALSDGRNGPDAPGAQIFVGVLEFGTENNTILDPWTVAMRPAGCLCLPRLRVLRLTGTTTGNVWDMLEAVCGTLECPIWEQTLVHHTEILRDSYYCT